jgi:hypothetical protein
MDDPRNPYTAPQTKVGEPEPRQNWLYGKGRFGNVVIPSHPVVGPCSHCGEERSFRVFVQTECSHLFTVMRWNFESTFFRICVDCEHAFKLSTREIRQIFPAYRPPPPKILRRIVFLATWGVAFAFGAYVLIRQYWHF